MKALALRDTLIGIFIGSAVVIVFLSFAFGVNGLLLVFAVVMAASGVALFVLEAKTGVRR